MHGQYRASCSRSRRRATMASGSMVAAAMMVLGACGSSKTASTSSTSRSAGTTSSGAASAPLTKVTVADVPGGYTSIPFVVGLKLGVFAKNGLDVQLVSGGSGASVAATVVSGSAQIGDALNPQVVAASVQHGQDLRFICGEAPHSLGALVALPSSSLPTTAQAGSLKAAVAALKGKTIGVPALGAAAAELTNEALTSEGLPASSYTLVAVGVGATALGALDSGRVDVLFSYPFFQQNIEGANKVKQLVDLTSVPVYFNTYASGIAASQSWITSHETTAKAVCTAYEEAAQAAVASANQATVTAILEQQYNVSASAIPAAMGVVRQLSTEMTSSQIEAAYSSLVAGGLLKSSPAVSYANTVMRPK